MESKDLELKREIILSNYENPEFKIENPKKLDKTYKTASKDSPSCIDNISAHVKIVNNKIQDVKFSGIGCAIATSSTNIMCGLLKNKTLSSANEIIVNYFNLVAHKDHNKKLLGDLFVFDNIYKQLNRIKCATVGIEAIQKAINLNRK